MPKFPRELLQQVVADEAGTIIKDTLIDKGRWHARHELIFQVDDDTKTYRTYYSTGLTEYQDDRPFENDPVMIDVDEVELAEQTVKYWKRVD